MNKKRYFWKSILPVLIMVIFMIIAGVAAILIPVVAGLINGSDMSSMDLEMLGTDNPYLNYTNFIYGCVAVLIFGLWYHKVFVRPFRHKVSRQPGGYSFHTIVSFIFIALGMQYVSLLSTDLLTTYLPEALTRYEEVMQSLGLNDISLVVFLYTTILAPVSEELIFRGLIFRYARHAVPFWIANIWQAFLFGLIHMNLVQGTYAFLLGLVLGWIAKRGRGIRYTIPVHIIFNLMGLFCSGFIDFTTSLGKYPAIIGGVALLIFGLWIYYTDFYTQTRSPREEEYYDDDAYDVEEYDLEEYDIEEYDNYSDHVQRYDVARSSDDFREYDYNRKHRGYRRH